MTNRKELLKLPFIQELLKKNNVYIVGGSVRDSLLRVESNDIDLLVRGFPLVLIAKLLAPFGAVDIVGQSFGVIKFTSDGVTYDIAVPRTERKIGEGHQAFEIVTEGVTLLEDLKRRDFTMNSLALCVETGDIIDPFMGYDDALDKIIRMTSPASFIEDPLRMLRAVQFAARFDMVISKHTLQVISENGHKLREISGERISIELRKIVEKGDPFIGLKMLQETELFFAFTKEFKDFEFDFNDKLIGKIKTLAEFLFTIYRKQPEMVEDVISNIKLSTQEADELRLLFKMYACSCVEDIRVAIFEGAKKVPQITNSVYFDDVFAGFIYDTGILGDEDHIRAIAYCGRAIKDMGGRNYPINIKQIGIDGSFITSSFGLQGVEIGKLHRNIVRAILYDKVNFKFSAIINMITDGMGKYRGEWTTDRRYVHSSYEE